MRRLNQRGYMLMEAIVYIGCLMVVISLAYFALNRCSETSRNLQRYSNDIVQTVSAGEHWREDIRHSKGPPHVTKSGELHIPQISDDIIYTFTNKKVWRQQGAGKPVEILSDVKMSSMSPADQEIPTVWRWEVELSPSRKLVKMAPLFTFQAAVSTKS